MRPTAVLLAATVCAALLAGCLGGNPTASSSTTDSNPPLYSTVVVHQAGGKVVPAAQYKGTLPVFAERYVGDRGAGEPTIGVNARGVAIFPSIAFDVAGGGAASTRIFISKDNGTTWTDKSPSIANLGAVPAQPTSLDPFVYADPGTGRLFTIDLYVGCANMSYSDDDGTTWTTNPIACGIPVDDHQSIIAGPPVPPLVASPLYPNVLYYCVNQIGATTCTRSFDGGLTWTAGSPAFPGAQPQPDNNDPLNSFCGGLSGHVYASRVTGTVFMPKGQCGKAMVARSTDNGNSWTPVTVDSAGIDGHDASVAVDGNGTVYYFYLDPQSLPRLAVSHDDGASFEAPINVTLPGITAGKFPAITAGDAGRIAFYYVGSTVKGGFDAKSKDMDLATWNGYVGMGLDADKPNPTFASTTINPAADPLKRGDCSGRCQGMFDFFDIQINPATGQVWTSAVDLCNDKCAGPDGTNKDAVTSRGAVGVQVGGTMLKGP